MLLGAVLTAITITFIPPILKARAIKLAPHYDTTQVGKVIEVAFNSKPTFSEIKIGVSRDTETAQKALEEKKKKEAIKQSSLKKSAQNGVIDEEQRHRLTEESGISPLDFFYVDFIISHESGWNPNAKEPTSKAEGLPQALPYSKTGCTHGDALCQLKWANSYAIGRYGSWEHAYQFWVSHRWW